MSTRKKPKNFAQRLLRRTWRLFNTATKGLVNWVLRSLMVHRRRSRQSQAGFVLPTVVMVLLVVVLLTTAIVIRSFDRAKNASNIRVDQAVLNAATPAIDRARAKIERLFSQEETRLSGNPPPEGKNYDDPGTISYVLSQSEYTFGDETPLKVAFDIDGSGSTNSKDEQIKTAWKFYIDTDNDGKFDSITLYGIFFRNPDTDRARTPIEARALPQAADVQSKCASGGSAASSFQQQQGWFETDGQLKKAFFTYVANVPITELGSLDPQKYQLYKGNRSFSGLEMQQDQGRVALDNNAVWFNDDLVISNVPPFRLNGRIHTNSNLMVANPAGFPITFYQVSSINSCFYTAENAKIIVGGHVAAGDITGGPLGQGAGDSTGNTVEIHLYQGIETRPDQNNVQYIDADNKTTTLDPAEIATNSSAYQARLNLLIEAAIKRYDTQYPNSPVTDANVENISSYPPEVKTTFKGKYDPEDAPAGRSILRQVLETYFAARIRRVSYDEVGINENALGRRPSDAVPLTVDTVFQAGGIMPPLEWMRYNTADPADLPVKSAGGGLELEATLPKDRGIGSTQEEYNIGDRIDVGNSLPRRWLKADNTNYAEPKAKQDINGARWNDRGGGLSSGPDSTRYRQGLVQQLDDLGDTSRGGYWERASARSGKEFQEDLALKKLAGGLRVITGAGIYIDGTAVANGGTGVRGVDSFLPAPPAPTGLEIKQMAANDPLGIKLPPDVQKETNPATLQNFQVVWPDTMPMFDWKDTTPNGQYDPGELKRGDLQMRATVVYHYAKDEGPQQAPIACIASFYDPTSEITAKNANGIPYDSNPLGASVNGINYPVPSASARASATGNLRLLRQANMLFPDGRWVNEPLRKAVIKLRDKGLDDLTLADIAAIDAANCAFGILDNPTGFLGSGLVPNGAIQEKAFLDARQVTALTKRRTDKNGNLLQDINAAGTFVGDTRATTRQDISNPDKLKIAELGELSATTLTEYSLPIEQRQPLEIRVTQIDLNLLRTTQVPGVVVGGTGVNDEDEYLLPNSGIIYASRDDALLDITNFDLATGGDAGSSAIDFKLDPTRRPNGILLVNGKNLARENQYRIAEKGLILASDLPVYIKGEKVTANSNEGGFNFHFQPGTTTVREEFQQELQDNYNNFYTRDVINESFACRPTPDNPASCPNGGDQWRAARILSDAVTLLSSNFRFGYRNEGDYDLNNHIGNLAVESRLKNGFWWESFATNTNWYDNTGAPRDFDPATPAIHEGSSYATNGVTSVQRRASFTEYRMEICRKLPVAACGPGDWILEDADGTGTKGSGTTAPISDVATSISYVPPKDRRYPRRLAFRRNSLGQLVMPNCNTSNNPLAPTVPDPNCKPVPIAVRGTSYVDVLYDGMTEYGTGVSTLTLPPAVANNNALWYWTTAEPSNPSGATPGTPELTAFTSPPNVSYNNTNKLYYAPFEPEEVSERQLILPGLPEFPTEMGIITTPALSLNSTIATGSTNLRSAPSDYAVLTFDGASYCRFAQDYKPTTLADCPPEAVQTGVAIENVWAQLLTYNPPQNNDVVSISDELSALQPGNPAAPTPITLQAKAKVNIYNLPRNELLQGVELILDQNNRIDEPIFVFRSRGNTQNFIIGDGTKLTLKGVDPNNIFWVPFLNLQIRVNPGATQSRLAGNFINGANRRGPNLAAVAFSDAANAPYGGTPPLTAGPIIQGGRFLGFATPMGIPAGVMTAMATTAQPLVIPVLNLHSPVADSGGGVPSGDAATAFGPRAVNETYWVQHVPSTATESYNAAFIMGDSPSRPFPGRTGGEIQDSGESGGGLANFPRFLEAWEDIGPDDAAVEAKTKIRGSFIQFKKSIFATAPFEAIDDPTQDNSLFFDPNPVKPDYMAAYGPATNTRPFIYKGGGQKRKAPYYRPPQRLWGYDVGLLSQTPDLFARRFAVPSAGVANEYYREVSRDDQWIQTLLCAAEQPPAAPGGGTPSYSQWAIADSKQRPGLCQETEPGNNYSDPT